MSNCCNHDDDCPNNPANWEDWVCGDCGTTYSYTVDFCTNTFDDYLANRGGSIESAITRAVDKAIQPLVDKWRRREANGEWQERGGTWVYTTFEDPLKSLYTVNYRRTSSGLLNFYQSPPLFPEHVGEEQ